MRLVSPGTMRFSISVLGRCAPGAPGVILVAGVRSCDLRCVHDRFFDMSLAQVVRSKVVNTLINSVENYNGVISPGCTLESVPGSSHA